MLTLPSAFPGQRIPSLLTVWGPWDISSRTGCSSPWRGSRSVLRRITWCSTELPHWCEVSHFLMVQKADTLKVHWFSKQTFRSPWGTLSCCASIQRTDGPSLVICGRTAGGPEPCFPPSCVSQWGTEAISRDLVVW